MEIDFLYEANEEKILLNDLLSFHEMITKIRYRIIYTLYVHVFILAKYNIHVIF